MKRRDFMLTCAASAILVHQRPGLLAAGAAAPEFHHRARLVDPGGHALRASELEPHRNYIFHYPYRATPCFLLDLGRATELEVPLTTEDGRDYVWTGGTGPGRSIVAYAAICAHRMSYPTESVNFIAYRHGEVARHSDEGGTVSNVIKCCNEFSIYDPARGAAVVSGPAYQPLTGILLEHDPGSDGLSAVGVIGGTLFRRFFEKYDLQLALAWNGIENARAPVIDQAVVQPLDEYTANNVSC
ncbi:MAG: hypothetical protein R3225_01955 [Halofilum sp. (in: g-proteobacteria)]|nr:hypothetical protein [Halofilum sp. (in: g-proteobacteria)]